MSYLESLFSLKGKTAVVIGGTGELCGAMAGGLAGAGAEIVLVGRSEEKAKARIDAIIEETTSANVHFISADVSSREGLQSILDGAVEKAGKIDILVNGAGVNSPTPFLEIPEDEYDWIFDVNCKSVVNACQIFGAYFLEQKRPASIINVGSMSGLLPLSRVFTYSMTKAAIHNLTKNLAREWAEAGIRVNTVVPGFFPAEQNKKVLNAERVESIMGHTPARRFGEAQELIGATLLLASDAAGSFITGHELVVDGGYSSMTI